LSRSCSFFASVAHPPGKPRNRIIHVRHPYLDALMVVFCVETVACIGKLCSGLSWHPAVLHALEPHQFSLAIRMQANNTAQELAGISYQL
jgi:hypothetical protein